MSPAPARRATRGRPALALVALLAALPLQAGPADVVSARARCRGEVCDFQATVRHADTGWEHYADRFEVLTPDGEVLGTRVLRHPHVKEQPFTRALQGVRVPAGVERVRVRASDSVHGLGGAEVELELERDAAPAP